MRLSQLLDETTQRRQVSLPVGDDQLTVTYDERQITPTLVGTFTEQEPNGGTMPALITSLVTEWNLTDDAGNPVPLAAESLRELPMSVLDQIIQLIWNDIASRKNRPEAG